MGIPNIQEGIGCLLTVLLLGCSACSSPASRPSLYDEPAMVLVPAGWFLMGSDAGPSSSRPAHWVYLEAYRIDRTEVTNAQMLAYVEATGEVPQAWHGRTAPGPSNRPATGLRWREAQAYCHWLGMRLPTEAEWEKAARGTDGRSYPWGDTWDASRANTAESGRSGPVEVGTYPSGASPYGALDMVGNVQEWVADYYDPGYYAVAPARAPTGPSQVLDHGLRGGSWDSPKEWGTTFFRDSSHSAVPNDRTGFRCAVTLS